MVRSRRYALAYNLFAHASWDMMEPSWRFRLIVREQNMVADGLAKKLREFRSGLIFLLFRDYIENSGTYVFR